MVKEITEGSHAGGRLKKEWKAGATKLLIMSLVVVFVLVKVLELRNVVIPYVPSALDPGNNQNSSSSISPAPMISEGEGLMPSLSANSSSDTTGQMIQAPPVSSVSHRNKNETDDGSGCSACAGCPVVGEKKRKKKGKRVVDVLSISDMDDRLLRSRAASSKSTTPPRSPSAVDQEMLNAKAEIEKAPIVTDDPELYGLVFRNLSTFKRSYELMDKILKVYVYQEGDKPIFREPTFTGIYASEGWFMNQMLESRKFVVKDPSKAHLFYIPFSSVSLRYNMYIPDSHSRKNMIAYLKTYVDLISSQNPFWNRTCGADHFVAGCHDWAAAETEGSMKTTLRALCTADVHLGFDIGKDVSLPATRIAVKRKPQLNIGGKPANKRTTLAFFAGQMHGYLRPILIQQWENKDPDMVITGPIPHHIRKNTMAFGANMKKPGAKVNPYLHYMKTSKYCLCPRGSQVWSTRVMESIYYGCVPVIISDNFVPPLFEVLNWPAFSVILPEKDVPVLKQVLVDIPRTRYLELERGVREVRKHFLWNRKPVKYDLFHMILHSIWFNRLYQIPMD